MYGLYEYVSQGGWVMIPLVLCSLLMWGLIIDRFRAFREYSAGDLTVTEAVRAVKGSGGAERRRGLRASLVRDFLAMQTGDPELDRDILLQCSQMRRPELTRSISVIAVLAAISPLLGLLGTVLGMIETFQVISLFGTGNAKALAGGISVALVTTQTGLLVAIPGLFLAGMLRRRARRLATNLGEITTVLERVVRLRGDTNDRGVRPADRQTHGAVLSRV
jgi:biopolymer transport protein ExbB